MNIGKRTFGALIAQIADPLTWSAFAQMFRVHTSPVRMLVQELFSSGDYPLVKRVRTQIGVQEIHLFHPEDLSTLNLIFCRRDYLVPEPLNVAVDIGANVGISSLFWLTRNRMCRVYAYEPVPKNVERLKINLAGFDGQYVIESVAVSDVRGTVEFGIEETGKLGGIGLETGETIQVKAVHIMDVLEPVLTQHGKIDTVKVDTEGTEQQILKAIDPDCWKYIRTLNVEDYEGTSPMVVPDSFTHIKRGSAMQFRNRSMI